MATSGFIFFKFFKITLLLCIIQQEIKMPISKKTIEYRKTNDLCPRCGQPNIDGKSLCQKHLDEFAAKALKYRHIKISKGLCPECGGKNEKNQYCCNICKEKNKPKLHKSYLKRYITRKKNNKCVDCGKDSEPNRTQCKICSEKDALERNNKYIQRNNNGLCVICGKNKVDSTTYCEECVQKRSEWYKKSNTRIKNKLEREKNKKIVFEHYGNICGICKEDDVDVLSIDHINNDGKTQRKQTGIGSRFYEWIIENNFPTNLQILCCNCNIKKYKQTLDLKNYSEEVRIIDDKKIDETKVYGVN